MAAIPSAPTPYRFTREEYYRMWESGLFSDKSDWSFVTILSRCQVE